jgi:hypothetical protein
MSRDFAKGRFLFHGTRYRQAIERSDRLRCALLGDTHVSLTRDWNVAVYWASLPRDDDEGEGGIFVFDRRSLAGPLTPTPFVCEGWGGEDEHEEAVTADIFPLSAHLVATIPVR